VKSVGKFQRPEGTVDQSVSHITTENALSHQNEEENCST